MSVLIEACVDSVASALAAERGGAQRVELCDSLFDGGTTPSAGMISAVKAAVRIPVVVIVRPRGGGFVYERDELGVMRLDVEAAKMFGADGIAIGALTRERRVDVEAMRALVDAALPLPVTFHRAFDLAVNLDDALEALIQLGVTRVLTSGGATTALEGVERIAALHRRAAGQITVMAGGGIREETVQEIVHRSQVRDVHVRGARLTAAPGATHSPVRFRKPLPPSEDAWEETDEQRIRDFVKLANG